MLPIRCVFFFALRIRETSRLARDLIIESFMLYVSVKISVLIEHLGEQTDEPVSILKVHIGKVH